MWFHPCASLFLALPLVGQTVHHVGPGGFAQIRDAIVAAAPGDVIEVVAGTYLAFTLDKALTITALPSPPGTIVQVLGTAMMVPSITELRPPAGTCAVVTNVHFRNLWWNYWQHSVRVTRGTVCFEECTFEGAYDVFEPALRVQNAAVHLRHCLALGRNQLVTATAATIDATNSEVLAVDCTVLGGALTHKAGSDGGNGIDATDSRLHLVRTDVAAGGSNGIACINGWGGGHGVRLLGASTAWLADCTVRGGDGFCRAGGDALRNLTSIPVQLARTTLTPGTGTPSGGASIGPTSPAPLLGLSGGTTGLTRGQAWHTNYRTEPFWPIAVLLADDVLVQSSPLVAERLVLPLGDATTFALLVADGTGTAALQTTVPPLAILQHQRAYLQAFSGIALPVRTQPALGGVIR